MTPRNFGCFSNSLQDGGRTMRSLGIAVAIGMTIGTSALAQAPGWRFHWQAGQVLHYRVEHTTNVSEVLASGKVATSAKVNLVKRWEVVGVDAQGIATVKMSITQMRNEQTRPNGEVILFDSTTPEKSTPELREQMAKYIGQTVALVRVDPLGRVVEVKQGVASRYEVEPPFLFTLPASAVAAGQSWERPFTITLDPPLGTGEKHAATQKYYCAKTEGGLATITLTTQVPAMPEIKSEQLPLLQKMPQGEIVFDVQRGRLHSARLVIDRQVQGHQGVGSVYHLQSTYSERIAE
jgi:hypothetical protein